jgi:CHAT domain-containing protein
MEFCPVCMLRAAIPGTVESGASSFEEAVKSAPDQPGQRFDHYELVMGKNGKPLELGGEREMDQRICRISQSAS